MSTKKKFNADRILGISAMLISLLTLAICIYQTDIMRVQSKLSVKPRLDFTTNQGGNDTIIIFQEFIENKGLGPAIIDSIYFKFEGNQYALSPENFMKENLPRLLEFGTLSQHATMGKGMTLSHGESMCIYTYKLHHSKLDSIFAYLDVDMDSDDPFPIEVIYTSMYEDEFWKVSSEVS
ncbi:MAG: hypothetical protein AAFP96_03430, partial [Bacteroidota bacterium]